MKVPSEVGSKEWILNGRWPGFGYCQIRVGPLIRRASFLPAATFASRMARAFSRIGLGQLLFAVDPPWLNGPAPPDLDPTLVAFLARHGDDLRRRVRLPLGDAEAHPTAAQQLSPTAPQEGDDARLLADQKPPRIAGPLDTAGAAFSVEPEPIAKSNFTVVAPKSIVPAGKPEISPAPSSADKSIELEPQEAADAAMLRGPEHSVALEVPPALACSPDYAPPSLSLQGLAEPMEVGAPSASTTEPLPRLAEPESGLADQGEPFQPARAPAATPEAAPSARPTPNPRRENWSIASVLSHAAPSGPPPLGLRLDPLSPVLREVGELAGLKNRPTEGDTNRTEGEALSPEIVGPSVEFPQLPLDKAPPLQQIEPAQPELTVAPPEAALTATPGQTFDVPSFTDLVTDLSLSSPLSAETPTREDGTVDTWTKARPVPSADVNRLRAPLLTAVVTVILNRCKTSLDTTKLDFRWSLADLADWEALSHAVSHWAQNERVPPHSYLAKSHFGRTITGEEALGLAFIAFAAVVGRTLADPDSLWLMVWKALSAEKRQRLFDANCQPRREVKEAVEKATRRFSLRHGFAGEVSGQRAYVRTVQLQYGIGASWSNVSANHAPAIVEDLIDENSRNYSRSFRDFWESYKRLRGGALELDEAWRRIEGSAWAPAGGRSTLERFAESRHEAEREALSLFGEPLLIWQGGRPRIRLPLTAGGGALLEGDAFSLQISFRDNPDSKTFKLRKVSDSSLGLEVVGLGAHPSHVDLPFSVADVKIEVSVLDGPVCYSEIASIFGDSALAVFEGNTGRQLEPDSIIPVDGRTYSIVFPGADWKWSGVVRKNSDRSPGDVVQATSLTRRYS